MTFLGIELLGKQHEVSLSLEFMDKKRQHFLKINTNYL
jgi:hypothetical protein